MAEEMTVVGTPVLLNDSFGVVIFVDEMHAVALVEMQNRKHLRISLFYAGLAEQMLSSHAEEVELETPRS